MYENIKIIIYSIYCQSAIDLVTFSIGSNDPKKYLYCAYVFYQKNIEFTQVSLLIFSGILCTVAPRFSGYPDFEARKRVIYMSGLLQYPDTRVSGFRRI